jgi:hypothetical protein
MIGEKYISEDKAHIIELVGYGIYGPIQTQYFKFIYPKNMTNGYMIHMDYMWSYTKLQSGPNIENMKLGDMYIHNETKNIIMVEEVNREKLIAKFKYILAEGIKHKEGDSVWFDLRIVDSRWTKLEGDEEGNKEG